MSKWLNNEKPLHDNKQKTLVIEGEKCYYTIKKPCHELGFCPYGLQLEEYPFSKTKRRCKTFGHDCPVCNGVGRVWILIQ